MLELTVSLFVVKLSQHKYFNNMLQKSKPQLIKITDLAVQKIAEMVNLRGKPTAGIRIGIRTKGCSGLSYTLEYSDQINSTDEIIEAGAVKVLVDPKSVLFLIGSTMDYKEEEFASGFMFTNPNEKGRCGCGESFHI